MIRLGVISDTHGLMRPEALDALQGSELILHAGDIGKPEILEALSDIAPVRAIRGNNDTDEWASHLPECEIITIDEVQIYMLHDVKQMKIDPVRAGHSVVISGHSHKPSVDERDGVLFLNPGSAGPRRFKLPVYVAILVVNEGRLDAKIVELNIPAKADKHQGAS
ncbi:MAG: metallophosphatase family protein [Proteobacteria bacterium]|nr:metallophosphatase family protein [Pseudomonadota bacterium]